MSLSIPSQQPQITGTGALALPTRTAPPNPTSPTPEPPQTSATPTTPTETSQVDIPFGSRASAEMDPVSGLTQFGQPGTATQPPSENPPAATEPPPTAEEGASGTTIVSRLGLTAARTATAYNAVTNGAQTGIVAPMPPAPSNTPAPANTGPESVSGTRMTTATVSGTVRHATTLLNGDLTGGDVVALGQLAQTVAGTVHTRRNSEATAVLAQRAGGLAAGAGMVGFATNLATHDYSRTGQNMQAVLADPGNEELRSQALTDARGLATGVQDVTDAARSAVPALDAARGTLGTATTTAGRIAERAAGPGMRAAATAGRMAGRFAPGVNIAVAAVDTAVAANDITRAINNPTRDNVVNAAFSGVVAAGSIAAASNIPVVSQVGAAVSMGGDAARLVYNNRDAIARETTRVVREGREYVGRQASRAVTAVAESRPVRAAAQAVTAGREYVSRQATRAVAAVADTRAGRAAAQAYNWARSWF